MDFSRSIWRTTLASIFLLLIVVWMQATESVRSRFVAKELKDVQGWCFFVDRSKDPVGQLNAKNQHGRLEVKKTKQTTTSLKWGTILFKYILTHTYTPVPKCPNLQGPFPQFLRSSASLTNGLWGYWGKEGTIGRAISPVYDSSKTPLPLLGHKVVPEPAYLQFFCKRQIRGHPRRTG